MNSGYRTILHCDCNNYYASVESIFRPELHKVPMAVCGDPKGRRGIVLAKNELAKTYGIVTAEPIWQAVKKCPALVLVPPQHDQYQLYCDKINEIYQQYSDLVEGFSIDESWLDVTGSRALFGEGKTIADTLRQRVKKELGLTISVGVSFNKTFAKLASNMKKPDATTVLSPENYQEILYPMPVETLLFVGKNTGQVLRRHGYFTIGDIAREKEEQLITLLGKAGQAIYTQARGEEADPVRPYWDPEEIKSIGNGMTFPKDLVGEEEMKAGLLLLCDKVGSRLRAKKMKGTTLSLQIKTPQFETLSRQMALSQATQSTADLYKGTVELLEKSWQWQAPVRLFTVTVNNLVKEDQLQEQLSFFSDDHQEKEKFQRIEKTVDHLRSRFGNGSITFGSLLKEKEPGKEEKPILEE
ncbi:MAG: DNA polymerase IV [Clostridiales bacterium]|nr:DNA polymerase IV [Clostridiales bacterium]